jgi:hypothetical protein
MKRNIERTLGAAGVLVLVLVGAAACGDDDSADEDSTTTTEAAEDTTTTTAATTETTSAGNVSDRLRAFLDAEYADFADQVEGIGSVDLSEDEAQVTLTIGDEPADADTGVAICEAVVEFGDQDGLSSLDIEVENDENGDDALLATGDLDDGCEAA